MAHPRKRHDAYGRPLPTLAPAVPPVPAAPRSLTQSKQNTAMRQYLVQLLEEKHQVLFTEDMYAEVRLTLTIKAGTILSDVDVEITHHHRYQAEED